MKTGRTGTIIFALIAAFMASALSAASAQTLDAITKRGKILVAMDLGMLPYSFTNQNMQPEGSDVETAQLLAKDLGVELEIVPTNSQGRIPSLLTGKADVVISTFAITPERAKSVAFSRPYGYGKNVVFAEKSTDIKSMDDLPGKKIGLTRGAVPDILFPQRLPQGVNFVRFDDEASLLAALAAGQVDGIGTASDRFLTLEKRFPGRFESKLDVDVFYYGIATRRDDPDFLHWLNTWVFTNLQNGNLATYYEKWLQQPLREMPAL